MSTKDGTPKSGGGGEEAVKGQRNVMLKLSLKLLVVKCLKSLPTLSF